MATRATAAGGGVEAPPGSALITPADGGVAYWFLDTLAIVRTPRHEGAPEIIDVTIRPGGSPPLHVHSQLDDSFLLLEGTLAVRCGDERFIARQGAYVYLPRGVPHTFRVLGVTPARFLQVHADDSFRRLIETLGEPATERRLPGSPPALDWDEVVRAHHASGVELVGESLEEPEAEEILRHERR